MDHFFEIMIVLIVFTAPALPIFVIGMIYFLKKRLEHKQVLAAIEKGVPVSELSIGTKKQKKSYGPGWIQDRSKAIKMLVIGIGISFVFMKLLDNQPREMSVLWVIPVVFIGKGVGLLVRSKMRRKYEPQEPTEQEDSEQTQNSIETP